MTAGVKGGEAMGPSFEGDSPGLTRERLAECAAELGVRLPEEYARFLLERNGGRPVPARYSAIDADGETEVEAFLGIRDDGEDDLSAFARKNRAILPEGFLPVAYDVRGNLICISTSGGDEGRVYFWNRELAATADDPRDELGDHITIIASSFDEFLNSFAPE